MSPCLAQYRPLPLSAEEALALLDLCVASNAETSPVNDRVIRKLADLVRSYLAEEPAADAPFERRAEGWNA